MITPESLSQANTEHAHQTALFCWAALLTPQYPELALMFAIPNGGERNKIVAARLKAEGVKAAIPDIFLPVARGAWYGFFIEMKRPATKTQREGTATEGQLQMIESLRKQGYACSVCVGWEAAKYQLLAYLDWR